MKLSGRRGKTETVRADRDVVLCAGAYGSPQLMMVSGIGPADHLSDVGVGVRHDLPGVGQNLHDHPFCVCIWDAHDGPSLLDAEKPRALLEWVLRKSGPLTSPVAEALGFVKTRPGLPAADIQFHMAPAYYVDHGETVYEGHACTIGPGAGHAQVARAADAALGRPFGPPADRPQRAQRARGRGVDAGRHGAGARDRALGPVRARAWARSCSPART